MEINEDFLEQIKDVVDVLSAGQGEYSNVNDQTPLEKFVGTMIETNKLENRTELYKYLQKIAIKEDRDVITEYATSTYKKLSDEQKDAVHSLMLAMIDYKNEDTAYAKHLFIAEKVIGLIKTSGKDIEDYKEEKDLFQDKVCWSKMNGEDVANFPQYVRQLEPVNELIKGMDGDYWKDILDLIGENDDYKEELIRLIMVADIGVGFIRMFKNLSELSTSFSTVKSGSLLKNTETEDEEVDLDDLQETLENFLVTKLNCKKSKAEDIAESIIDLIEDEKDKDLENIGFLLEGKPKALYKDKDYKIVSAIKIIYFYLLEDLSAEDKVEATKLLLPFAYIAAMIDEPLSEVIDLDLFDDYIDDDEDEFEDEDFDANMDEMQLEDAVALDYLTGTYLVTHYLGKYEDEDFYVQLAKLTIPNLSYEYFENRLANTYEDKLTIKSITSILEKDYSAYSEKPDLIYSAAKAIYDAIVE